MYQQVTNPVGGSLGWSAACAAIPLVLLFILLGVFRIRAWVASIVGLVVAVVVAVVGFGMPGATAALSASEGAAFGLWPAMWIVLNAIWIYQMTRATGDFDRLRESFARVSGDKRVQGIIIAFSFGALLEALAGFGAPVAICSVMLVALGLPPLRAAAVSLIANTAPVAWGAVGLPIITLGQVTGLPVDTLSHATANLVPVLALFVPLLLLVVLDGRRGVREVWPAAVVAGVAFAVAQYAIARVGPVQLVDIIASLCSAAAVVVLLRFWQPRGTGTMDMEGATAGAGGPTGPAGPAGNGSAGDGALRDGSAGTVLSADTTTATATAAPTRAATLRAFAPYLVIIVLFTLSVLPGIKDGLAATTVTFHWPGLDVRGTDGKAVALTTFKFDWLANSGTVLLIAGIVTAVLLRVRARAAVAAYGATVAQVRTAGVTVMAVLALAYVMNLSGQTTSLGLFLAGAGAFFAVLSPLLGWFGTAVTGSDTSSNSLFGALQVAAAHGTGMSPVLAAAANSAGGVLGKMISPQNLAIGAAAVGLGGREGELLRRVVAASCVLVPAMCLLVWLESTPILGWVVP